MIRSNAARLFAENFDARHTGIVIWTDDPYFKFVLPGTLKSLRNRKIQELLKKSDFEKVIWSIIARLFAENFDARLPDIVIWSDRPYFDFFYQGTLKSLRNHKIQVPKFQGRVFRGKKSAYGRHIDHGGWERARHSHTLQVYRHPTSIQTPTSYTDTLQVYSTKNTSPDT